MTETIYNECPKCETEVPFTSDEAQEYFDLYTHEEMEEAAAARAGEILAHVWKALDIPVDLLEEIRLVLAVRGLEDAAQELQTLIWSGACRER